MVVNLDGLSMELVGLRNPEGVLALGRDEKRERHGGKKQRELGHTSFWVTVLTKGFMAIPVDQSVKPEGMIRMMGGPPLGSLIETVTESSVTSLTRASDETERKQKEERVSGCYEKRRG